MAGTGDSTTPATPATPAEPPPPAAPSGTVTAPLASGNDRPVQDPPVVPATPAAPAAAPAAPDGQVTMSQAQMADRLKRGNASYLRTLGADFGVENEEQLAAILARDKAAQAKAETDRTAALSREETLQEQLDTANSRASSAEEAQMFAQFQSLILGTCNTLSIRNTAYAEHMVLNAAAEVEGEFDERAFLENLAKDPKQAAALGIVASAAPDPVTGATTSPNSDDAPPPPPAGGDGPKVVDASKMTNEEYAAYRARVMGGAATGTAFG